MSYLICQNVSFSYEGNTVLSDINFSVNGGDYVCIVGENGAGKSTIIKGLLGLKKPSKGEILTGDGLRADEIGYLPQQTDTQRYFPASVLEVVLSGRLNSRGLKPFYSREDKEIAKGNISLLGIEDLSKHCYRELSGGQQQRVLLARALCATRKLLLLDEPVSGLDPVMSVELYRLIRNINKEEGITILMVSHDIHGAIDNASHILHLGRKQLFFGATDQYLKSEIGLRFAGGEQI